MRRPDVQGLRQDLKRAELLAEEARSALGQEAQLVDSARAILEEAQGWLPPAARAKPIRHRTRGSLRPEALLFQACSTLLQVERRLNRALHAHYSLFGLVRVRELVRTAFDKLGEAWLAYLYAHGLPAGHKPVRALPRLGGKAQYFLWAVAINLVSILIIPKEMPGMEYMIFPWAAFCLFIFRRWGHPQGERTRPCVLPQVKILKRLLPWAFVLAGLPFLGLLLRPDLLGLFATLSVVSLGLVIPSVAQALRLLLFPADARVLVLPNVYVVFVRGIGSWREEKVFLPVPLV